MLALDFDELIEGVLRVLDVLFYRKVETVQRFTNLLAHISVKTVVQILVLVLAPKVGISIRIVAVRLRRGSESLHLILAVGVDVRLAPVAAHSLIIPSPVARVVPCVESVWRHPLGHSRYIIIESWSRRWWHDVLGLEEREVDRYDRAVFVEEIGEVLRHGPAPCGIQFDLERAIWKYVPVEFLVHGEGRGINIKHG